MRLELVPVDYATAADFVRIFHRHHDNPPPGWKFGIGVERDDELVGVIMVGRPIARHYDDGYTLEVNRSCVDDCPNANSMLYAAAWRAAKALGYRRLITYTQEGETGASLRAAGWKVIAERPARPDWAASSKTRQRSTHGAGDVARTLWEAS